MPGSTYLQPADYAAYGVPAATAQQVMQASQLIDAYLTRPEGCIYVEDNTFSPAWMAKADPAFTLQLGADIAPGQNVPFSFAQTPGSQFLRQVQANDVFILDRATLNNDSGAICEAVVIGTPPQPGGNSGTLKWVQFGHSAGATMDAKMQVQQMIAMPSGRPITRVPQFPLQRILSSEGRYGYGRRSNSNSYALQEFNLLSTLQQFGGPPVWEGMDPAHIGYEPEGNIWVPAGILLAYFTEIRLRYVCGWTYASLPAQIKQACANLVTNAAAMSGLPPTLESYKAGDTQIKRFAASNMDADTQAMLAPYMSHPMR